MDSVRISQESFSTDQVCRITGITQRQARYWDREGIVKPSHRSAAGRGSRRLYSYADLLAIQAVKRFLDAGVSLQKMRRCVRYLRGQLTDLSEPLGYCCLVTDGDNVFLAESAQSLIDTTQNQGQRVFYQIRVDNLDRQLRRTVLEFSRKWVEALDLGGETYQVEITADFEDGGYAAEVAGLPGCITQGETVEEVLELAEDAIRTWQEAADDLQQRGVNIRRKRRQA
ncbi:MAG: MerR family transcriptional regulator [Phycisphaerae bacterium]